MILSLLKAPLYSQTLTMILPLLLLPQSLEVPLHSHMPMLNLVPYGHGLNLQLQPLPPHLLPPPISCEWRRRSVIVPLAPKDGALLRPWAQCPHHLLQSNLDVLYGRSWCVNLFFLLIKSQLTFIKLQKNMSYPGVQHAPPPEPSFTNRTVGEVVKCLINSKLVFPIMLDWATEHPWEEIDSAPHEQLSTHNFELKRRSGDDGKTFNRLSWDLMTKRKNKDHKIKYQGGMVDVSSFKVELLTQEAIQVNLQNETASFPFLFLGISPFITFSAIVSPNL
jgi:hypothetical protein